MYLQSAHVLMLAWTNQHKTDIMIENFKNSHVDGVIGRSVYNANKLMNR